MKKIIGYRKEVCRLMLKSKEKEIVISNFLMQKINNDIKDAQKARKKGETGTPIEEVLLELKKIIGGESP